MTSRVGVSSNCCIREDWFCVIIVQLRPCLNQGKCVRFEFLFVMYVLNFNCIENSQGHNRRGGSVFIVTPRIGGEAAWPNPYSGLNLRAQVYWPGATPQSCSPTSSSVFYDSTYIFKNCKIIIIDTLWALLLIHLVIETLTEDNIHIGPSISNDFSLFN